MKLLVLLSLVALCVATPARAQKVLIDVTGAERPIPVAVQRFSEDASSVGMS